MTSKTSNAERSTSNVEVDTNSYEFKERLAILQENNPDMHPVHAFNKAKKEIRERMKRQNLDADFAD